MKAQFRGNDTFWEAVEPLWNRRQSLQSEDGEDIVRALGDFSKSQRLALALWELESEGGSGGWDTFMRLSGYLTADLREALETVGATPYLKQLDQVLRAFPNGLAPVNNFERDALWEVWFENNPTISDQFVEIYSARPLRRYAEEFINARRSEFFE